MASDESIRVKERLLRVRRLGGKVPVFFLSLLLVALIGTLDYLTGLELRFSVFLLIPVALAAWRGFYQGVVISAAGAFTWWYVDLHMIHAHSTALISFWGTLVRLGIFLAFVYLIRQKKVISEDLKRANEWLDARVQKRTAALQAAYERLQHELAERRLAQEALEASEDRYRDLVEHSADLLCTHDLTGRVLSVNRPPAEILGYQPAELLEMSIRDILAPEVRDGFDEYLGTIRQSGAAKGLMVVLTRSGERRVWEYHNTLRTEGISEPIVRGMAHDVTERLRTEKALRESEGRFRSLVQNATVGIYRTTPDGRVLMANPRLLEMLGFNSFQELADRNLEKDGFEPGYPRSEFRERVEREGEVRGLEASWTRRDGSQIFVRESARVVRADDGRVLWYDGIVEDITERKQVEEALHASEVRYRELFENAYDTMATCDLEGRITSANKAAVRLSGYSREEVLGMTIFQASPPDYHETFRQSLQSLVAGMILPIQEAEIVTKDGRRLPVELSARTIDQAGELAGVQIIARDLTERKKAEELLRELPVRLLRVQDKERRRIARELHDNIGQMLVAIVMNLSTVKRQVAGLGERARQQLAESLHLAEHAVQETRLQSYLLHPPSLEEMGLASALEWFVDGFAKRSGVQVSLEVSPGFSRLSREAELAIYRIVQEGLANVHAHSGSKTAHVSLLQEPDQVVLTIADEGGGIPADVLQKPRRSGAGPGVGIPGIRERARELGGRLQVHSSSGGTTLVLTLPMEKLPTVAPA